MIIKLGICGYIDVRSISVTEKLIWKIELQIYESFSCQFLRSAQAKKNKMINWHWKTLNYLCEFEFQILTLQKKLFWALNLECASQWARKSKKSRPKKLVKSNKSFSENFFLTKFYFLPFQKWPKFNF